ncbi:MAG: zinc ribbon domain-containing protein [Chloroflexi bacterium]|nr:MAG: zinc ribbon domain-containing protein [Chloroflexota bacterium]
MPIYEYFCSGCQSRFELLRSISCADQDAPCPRCSAPARRIPSTFSAFNKSGDSGTTPVAGTGSSCSGCTASTCTGCH